MPLQVNSCPTLVPNWVVELKVWRASEISISVSTRRREKERKKCAWCVSSHIRAADRVRLAPLKRAILAVVARRNSIPPLLEPTLSKHIIAGRSLISHRSEAIIRVFQLARNHVTRLRNINAIDCTVARAPSLSRGESAALPNYYTSSALEESGTRARAEIVRRNENKLPG